MVKNPALQVLPIQAPASRRVRVSSLQGPGIPASPAI